MLIVFHECFICSGGHNTNPKRHPVSVWAEKRPTCGRTAGLCCWSGRPFVLTCPG